MRDWPVHCINTLDPRSTVFFALVLSASIAGASFRGLVLHTVICLILCRLLWHHLPPLKPLILGMAWLVVGITVIRGLTEPGDPVFCLYALTFSAKGLASGAVFGWRLLLMMLVGVLLAAAASPFAIRSAVVWTLKWVPGIPEERAGLMLGLMVKSITWILETAAAVSDAQKSRGIERRRQPVRRVRWFVTPLMTRVLARADMTALALVTRNYSDQRRSAPLRFQWRDAGAFCFVFLLSLINALL
ncbi:MAG: hypothetical protein CSA22_00400 [Deltaproteobacteria bacterium]|nr:MAG: hypothetical protein CSA22_00400 [Deltaproteobacteria bacterium]